jgi:hypothetical protein
MNDRKPIFLHGILSRSGSNYLARLLELHPDCALSTLPEDWFLADSHYLTRYAETLNQRWGRELAWNIEPEAGEDLVRHLGGALVSFLRSRSDPTDTRRILTKTPDVQGLSNFFRLFPDVDLLILIRDGRSVVESSVRSFGTSANQVARWWARAAGQIIDFDHAHQGSGHRFRLVRYEDLVHDPRKEVTETLHFLNLNPQRYDFSLIDSMPVYGSSTTREESGEWKWKVSPANDQLGSLERWSHWKRGQHERFNWIAGERLEALGYRPKRFSGRWLPWFCVKLSWFAEDLLRRAYWKLDAVFRRR